MFYIHFYRDIYSFKYTVYSFIETLLHFCPVFWLPTSIIVISINHAIAGLISYDDVTDY